MLHIVVGIVSFVGIPDAGEEIALPGHRATLHMNAVDETMLDVGSAPVAAPDQSAALRELSQKSEIAFPAGFSANCANDVTCQTVMVNADGSKFGCAVIEKLLLAILAPIRFVNHDFNSHSLGCRHKACHQLSGHWFKQGRVANADGRSKARIF